MTYYSVSKPYEVFFDNSGDPLENGYIYIGEANQNPITNPITVYWDVNGLYPAAQPIRTLAGYPGRNGSPSRIFIDSADNLSYSILIQDKNGELVYSSIDAISDGYAAAGSVDSFTDLRAVKGFNNPVYARGNTTIGDGGEGKFDYFGGAAPGTYVDDNGITIVPNGGDGSGAWIRQFSGPIEAAWYLMVDNTSCVSAVQAAIDYAQANASGGITSGPQSVSAYRIKLPQGRFLVDSTIDIPSYIAIDGENTVLLDSTKLVTMIDIVGYRNEINRIVFDGGEYQIRVIGPNADTMEFYCDHCEFRNPGVVSIFHDIDENHGPGSGTPRTGFSMNQVVSNFKSYSSPLIHAKCDKLTIDTGWAQFRPFLAAAGFSGDVFYIRNDNAGATVKDLLGVSFHDGSATDLSFWFRVGNSSTGIEADIIVENCRFGEAGSVIVYCDNAKKISFSDCAIFGRAGNSYAWCEIYNQIPSISVKRCEGWTDSLGILIDSATITDLDAELSLNNYDLSYLIQDNDDGDRADQIVYSTRATYKTNGLITPLINERLFPFEVNTGLEIDNRDRLSENLFTSGVASSGSGALATIFSSDNSGGANNTATGYTLATRVASADGAQYGKQDASWGATEAPNPGDYCFSCYVLTDKTISMDLRYNNKKFNVLKVPAVDDFVRVWGTFYHDGTNHSLGYYVDNAPNGCTFCVGLFQVNPGLTPTVYKFPGNSVSGFLPDYYYGTAAPVAGTYKKGDIVWATNVSAGGSIGWVCTTAGSPGTWKTFGTVAV
jgi:hypothetical protein